MDFNENLFLFCCNICQGGAWKYAFPGRARERETKDAKKGDNPVKLKICHPSEIFMDTAVNKVVAESPNGNFCILPRHIDTVMALVPGILAYFNDAGEELFLAINGGILVKQGDKVLIATRMAIKGELGTLRKKVKEFMDEVDEKERKTLSSLVRLEADFIHRFLEIGKNV